MARQAARLWAFGPMLRESHASQAGEVALFTLTPDMTASAPSPFSHWVGIVDDDLSIRRALARVFRAHDVVARVFASAEDYLGRTPHEEPFCLILDVRLGGMNGFELLERLCANGSSPPIILIAAMDEVPPTLFERMPGRLRLLRKPFGTDALIALVHEYSAGSESDGA